ATSLHTQHENGGTSSIGGLREARNGIKILDSKNIKIYNCKFSLLLSDGIRISRSTNVQVKECIIDCAGHDSISSYRSNKIKIDNCIMNLMINTCVRVYNSEDCSITNSTFKQSMSGTGAGYIELEGQADNVDINHNLFTASTDPVLFSAYSSGGKITINDNALYGVENLRASYAPYDIIRSNNAVFSDSADFAALGYGYTSSSSSHIISLDEGKETHGEPEELEELQEPEELEELQEPEEPEEPEESEEIVIDCEDETSPIYENCTESAYIDIRISQAETAYMLTNASIQDLNKAKLLLNGTEEDYLLAEKYMQAGNLKLKYAQELLGLSSQELTTTTIESGVL
uniref:right-handed parallel beta-helix repeat-containing protein n=1 Tax=Methanosarcina sp. UBA289 TaxID=1915574 RepID=UPI0025D9B2DE